jgi:hypothetical protein
MDYVPVHYQWRKAGDGNGVNSNQLARSIDFLDLVMLESAESENINAFIKSPPHTARRGRVAVLLLQDLLAENDIRYPKLHFRMIRSSTKDPQICR